MSTAILGIGLLLGGILVLVLCARQIVDAGIHIMHLFGLSATAVGVLVIAICTSLPELFVSAIASFRGQGSIAYGEILGSNTANIPIIFGLSLIIGKGLTIKDHYIAKRDAIFLCVATVLVTLMMSDLLMTRIEGMIALILFGLYVYIVYLTSEHRTGTVEFGKEMFYKLIQRIGHHPESVQKRRTIIIIAVCALGLFLGAFMTVRGAENLIHAWGLSPLLIGLVAIAIGTTLPEVAASITAVRRGQTEMGIANILGDNISSILLALGVSALIHPIRVERSSLMIDFPAVIFITVIFTAVLFWRGERKIPSWVGLVFLCLYTAILLLYIPLHSR